MSKLVDKLHYLSRLSPQMGFHPGAAGSAPPSMLLIAGLRGKDAAEARALAEGNIDAGLLLEQTDAAQIKQIAKAMGSLPLGVFLRGESSPQAAEIADSGGDFIVFDTRTPIKTLEAKGLGKLLAVEPSLESSLIGGISELEVDGVLIVNKQPVITIEHLLFCRRVIASTAKPLLMAVASPLTKEDINSLWEAGIEGVVTPPGQLPRQLSPLREMIAALPQRRKRRRGETGVALPHYVRQLTDEPEEEEEEEEET